MSRRTSSGTGASQRKRAAGIGIVPVWNRHDADSNAVKAKYVASREKDLIFTRELARRGITSEERLRALLEQTPVDEQVRERIRDRILRDFHLERDLNSVREPSATGTQQLAGDAGDQMEAE